MKELYSALVKVNAAAKNVVVDSSNPHFRNSYASLEAVYDLVKPLLASQGLAIVFFLDGSTDGVPNCKTMVIHESGYTLESSSPLLLAKRDPQQLGSAFTYYRRYMLMSLCGIAPTDDDGNAASSPVSNKPSGNNRSPEVSKLRDKFDF